MDDSARTPRPDSAAARRRAPFEWNAGGWFGSVLGGTLWMFLGSGALTAQGSSAAGAVWGACAMVGVGVGVVLWKRRESTAPHRAVQALLWALFALGVVAMASIDLSGAGAEADDALSGHGLFHGVAKYGFLLVFPVLSVVFAAREKNARAAA